jgi:hypothetical protein
MSQLGLKLCRIAILHCIIEWLSSGPSQLMVSQLEGALISLRKLPLCLQLAHILFECGYVSQLMSQL